MHNAYNKKITLNGVQIGPHQTKSVPYEAGVSYPVAVGWNHYTLILMNSNAEAAIYVNNPDADGNGMDLMSYLSENKSNKASATGAIVTPDGRIDNTPIKKIKGRGNTSWGKPKKKSRYVDFYVNGFYWGSYLLCEKIEPGSLLPEINEEDYLKDDFPFVMEVDPSAGDDDYSFNSNGLTITIVSPKIDPGEPGYEEVKEYVKDKFDHFYASTAPFGNLAETADVESVAKLYLINELGKNWDTGAASTFFTYRQDENGKYKFYGSPVWDYDNSMGNATGVKDDLTSMGVEDYEEYTGWWCQLKGKPDSGDKPSDNIIARISQNADVQAIVPTIWFEDFMPAFEHYSGNSYNEQIDTELKTREEYLDLIQDSAQMNYTSGWLLCTSPWIADHSTLNKATYDKTTQKMTVDETATNYEQVFEDMYNYASDWMLSRGAWLSEQYSQ